MEEDVEICCPWCGQTFEARVDTSVGRQQWIMDCEVCCRPIQVSVECADGEILSLDAREG
jgi:hypothetical protein